MKEGAHLTLANGYLMAILSAIVILVVFIQPIIFMVMAWRRGKEINISEEDMKTTIRSSGIFTIIPSLPIVISFIILAPALGDYFTWLRLSVVGSATYETIAANMAVQAFGYKDIFSVDITNDVYLGVVLFVSLGIIGGNVFNILFLQPYEKNLDKFKEKYSAWVPVITTAMLIGVYGSLSAPYITDYQNPLSIAAILVAGLTTFVTGKIAEKYPKAKEFSFSFSLIMGMLAASVLSAIIS